MTPRLVVILALSSGACAPATPGQPTWVEDVEPILMANCVRCHSAVPSSGAPSSFRLDRFEDNVLDQETIRGAQSMSLYVSARRHDMPAVGPSLSPRQEDILEKWASAPNQGTRAGNHLPTASLVTAIPGTVDADLHADILVEDADNDSVIGTLSLMASDGTTALSAPLYAGRQQVDLDTATIVPETYTLNVDLNDGIADAPATLGTISVLHSVPTAPGVTIMSPTTDNLIADRDSPFDVVFAVTDPDGSAVTADISVFSGTTSISIASGTQVTAGTQHLPLDTTAIPQGSSWRLKITVTDGTSSTTATSGYFFVSHDAGGGLAYADVQDILTGVCGQCHDALLTGPDFTSYIDIYQLRGRAWRKVVLGREMPPKSLDIVVPMARELTEDERTKLGAWLFAGAPQ